MKITIEGNPKEIAAYELALTSGKKQINQVFHIDKLGEHRTSGKDFPSDD